MPYASASSISLSTRPTTPLHELVSAATVVASETKTGCGKTETTVAGVLEGTTEALEALQTVLEAIDTVPFVKYIASISIQIIQVVLDAQDNNDAFRALAARAQDIVLTIAHCCTAMPDITSQLESDLTQLVGTMKDILSFAKEKVARKRIKKLWTRSEDAAAVKSLDTRLSDAFYIFEIQSNVHSRFLQHQIAQQISTLRGVPIAATTSVLTPFIPDVPLRISEGLYFIQSAVDDSVLEIEKSKKPDGSYTFLAHSQEGRLKTQLWYIKGKAKEPTYTIQSVATGTVLDIRRSSRTSGAHVTGHAPNGGGNQLWTFYGSRPDSRGDFCTIRSTGLETVLDAKCPISRAHCDCLHATSLRRQGPHASQEWCLVRFMGPSSLRPSHDLHLPRPLPVGRSQRRIFHLQSISSNLFATYLPDRLDGANIVLRPSPSCASEWTFIYAPHLRAQGEPDLFAIAAASPDFTGTIDHWGAKYINVSKFLPTDIYHGWAVIPRNGAFIFKNHASGRLLSAKNDSIVDVIRPEATSDPACHWRLIDASSGEISRILYDSTLSTIPSEFSRSPPPPSSPPLASQSGLTLQVAHATDQMQQNFGVALQAEHAMLRHLLASGYSAVVVAPQTLVGWREGRVSRLNFCDDYDELDEREVNIRRSMDDCIP